MSCARRTYAPQRNRRFEFMVRVQSRKYASWQGTIWHTRSGRWHCFRSVQELLLLLGEPRVVEDGASGMRSWVKAFTGSTGDEVDKYLLREEFDEALSKVGGQAFLVRVLFRQNATLQGEIVWLQKEKNQYFRSVLELLVLIQDALDEVGTPVAEYTFRSWKHDEEEEVVS